MRSKSKAGSFVEEELARERKLKNTPESKFRQILDSFERIFAGKSNASVAVGKDITLALAAQKYGIIYPTITDTDEPANASVNLEVWGRLLSDGGITANECRRLFETMAMEGE